MVSEQERNLVRRALIVSFGLSFFLATAAFFLGEGWGVLVCALSLFVLAIGGFLLLCRKGKPIRWMLALAILNGLTHVPELGLRLGGFYHGPRIQFGYPDPDSFQAFVRDPELFWINPPGSPGYNSLGFRSREIVTPKPPGIFRVLFLGDSCTAIGQPRNYPMIVEEILSGHEGEREFEVINLAVPGYSTHQGQVLARRYADSIEADVTLVYFGWNDHWQAYGEVDRDKRVPPRAEGAAAFFENLRLLQVLRYAASRYGPPRTPIDSTRVPPEHYRENLSTIVESFHAVGTPVLLITGPSTFRRKGVPQPLVDQGFLPDRESGLERHEAYLAMTRKAGELEGASLLDLAATFEEIAEPEPLFWPDGIHFTADGRRRVAEEIARAVLALLDE